MMDTAPTSKVISGYISLVETLLEAMLEVFPECPKTQRSISEFRLLIKPHPQLQIDFITEWHATVKPFYATIAQRDSVTLFKANIPIMDKLNIKEKWDDPEFDAESRQYFWEYIDQLNSFAEVYAGVPSQMLSRIELTSQNIIEQLQSGNFNPADMNIQAISEQVMQGMSEKDLEEFAANIPSLASAITSVGPFQHFAGMFGIPSDESKDESSMEE